MNYRIHDISKAVKSKYPPEKPADFLREIATIRDFLQCSCSPNPHSKTSCLDAKP